MKIKINEEVIFVCTCKNPEPLPTMIMSVLSQNVLPAEILIRLEGDPSGLSNFYFEQALSLAKIKKVKCSLEVSKSSGVRKARQALLDSARIKGYPYMWMGDDDVFYEANYLEELRKHFDIRHDTHVFAWFSGFKADVSNTRKYENFSLDIHDKIAGVADNYNLIYDLGEEETQEYSVIRTLDTGACIFRLDRCRNANFSIRDKHTNASGEDTVFALQLNAEGYRGLFAPRAAAWHLEKPSGSAYTEFNARGEMLLAMCDAHGWDREVLKEYMPYIWDKL